MRVELFRSTAEIRSRKKMSFSRLPREIWRAGKLRVEVDEKRILLFKGFWVCISSETGQLSTLSRCQAVIRVGRLLKRRQRTQNWDEWTTRIGIHGSHTWTLKSPKRTARVETKRKTASNKNACSVTESLLEAAKWLQQRWEEYSWAVDKTSQERGMHEGGLCD